jgi:hypothetical protein
VVLLPLVPTSTSSSNRHRTHDQFILSYGLPSPHTCTLFLASPEPFLSYS